MTSLRQAKYLHWRLIAMNGNGDVARHDPWRPLTCRSRKRDWIDIVYVLKPGTAKEKAIFVAIAPPSCLSSITTNREEATTHTHTHDAIESEVSPSSRRPTTYSKGKGPSRPRGQHRRKIGGRHPQRWRGPGPP